VAAVVNDGAASILIPEDFGLWRATLRGLPSRPGWKLVGEARDGPRLER